jgi:hypothetical protein
VKDFFSFHHCDKKSVYRDVKDFFSFHHCDKKQEQKQNSNLLSSWLSINNSTIQFNSYFQFIPSLKFIARCSNMQVSIKRSGNISETWEVIDDRKQIFEIQTERCARPYVLSIACTISTVKVDTVVEALRLIMDEGKHSSILLKSEYKKMKENVKHGDILYRALFRNDIQWGKHFLAYDNGTIFKSAAGSNSNASTARPKVSGASAAPKPQAQSGSTPAIPTTALSTISKPLTAATATGVAAKSAAGSNSNASTARPKVSGASAEPKPQAQSGSTPAIPTTALGTISKPLTAATATGVAAKSAAGSNSNIKAGVTTESMKECFTM